MKRSRLYFKEATHLRPRTRKVYEEPVRAFENWAKAEGICSTEELTPERVWAFRQHIAVIRKSRSVEGGETGEHAPTKVARSANTINRHLRTMSTIFNQWRRAGLVPQLHSDDIRDRLERQDVQRDEIDFLSAAQCGALLRACLAHDAARVRQSRAIAPFTAALLLTGMRAGEALGLEWTRVSLDDAMIRLLPADTKTNRGRRIPLTDCPKLLRMFTLMKRVADRPEHLGRDQGRSVFGQTGPGIQAARAVDPEVRRARVSTSQSRPGCSQRPRVYRDREGRAQRMPVTGSARSPRCRYSRPHRWMGPSKEPQ